MDARTGGRRRDGLDKSVSPVVGTHAGTVHESRARCFWLSMHVSYRCRHAGACCGSGWPIDVEQDRVDAIAALRADRAWLIPAPSAPPQVAGVLALAADGGCVFRNDGCEIQHAYGHSALPAACQHFPREIVIDSRGIFVTLSHYCPTAADLLFDYRGPVEIVEGPPPLPVGEPEGLDARNVLPPLLTNGVLMDPDGYSAWEAHMVRTLTEVDTRSPDEAIAYLDADVQVLQRWRPGSSTLVDAVANLRPRSKGIQVPDSPLRNDFAPFVPVVNRFLAAHAFASWMAYQGNGLPSVVNKLHLVLTRLKREIAKIGGGAIPMTRARLKEAIRQTDLHLVHLTDRDELSRRVEGWV